MTARIACRACGTTGPEFALRCAACDAPLPSVSIGQLSTAPDPGRADGGGDGLLLGQEVGPYRVEHVLGSGAMGVVYKAVDARLLRPVALKILSDRLAPSDRARGRMLREARAAARLRSKHVVQVLDHGVWQDRPYIAMEHLEGRTLRARLTEAGRLSPEETARWISQIAQGLDRAHAAGIVHRDLKPENVFLAREEDGEVAKILDFGVAKAAEPWADVAATQAGALLGTPAYMSPEQANGGRDLDHRSDLWSLGVIAFECLTGRRPFDREQLGALCVQILSAPLPVPSATASDLPASLDLWWQRAAARDPDARFQSAADLADALSEAILLPARSTPPDPEDTPASTQTSEAGIGAFATAPRAAIPPAAASPARVPRRAALALVAAATAAAAIFSALSQRPWTAAPAEDLAASTASADLGIPGPAAPDLAASSPVGPEQAASASSAAELPDLAAARAGEAPGTASGPAADRPPPPPADRASARPGAAQASRAPAAPSEQVSSASRNVPVSPVSPSVPVSPVDPSVPVSPSSAPVVAPAPSSMPVVAPAVPAGSAAPGVHPAAPMPDPALFNRRD